MHGNERREKIKMDLMKSMMAIKGSDLAAKYKVSRQVIVQDVALLRANGEQIISTADGYVYFSYHMNLPKRVFYVHHDEDEIEQEFDAILGNGGTILNVFINHPIYGDLVAEMVIGSQGKKEEYLEKARATEFKPLMSLTDNYHYHTVEATTEEQLDRIEAALRKIGVLHEEIN